MACFYPLLDKFPLYTVTFPDDVTDIYQHFNPRKKLSVWKHGRCMLSINHWYCIQIVYDREGWTIYMRFQQLKKSNSDLIFSGWMIEFLRLGFFEKWVKVSFTLLFKGTSKFRIVLILIHIVLSSHLSTPNTCVNCLSFH